jgi:[acyl-carrier-protein] S-malonyltransferase
VRPSRSRASRTFGPVTLAWLFPGQGSQSVGMGRDLVEASPAAAAVFARADAALGESLSKVIFEGPAERLTLTANAQPAILAMSCAVLAAIRERLPALALPALVAGHSLGEYSALVAADALSLEDAARLVRARGVAMQHAVALGVGAMSAILGIDRAAVETICAEASQGDVVAPANFNAPGQTVIAGHVAAVERAGALAAARNGRVRPLNVSAPFHCALMAPAAKALERELAGVRVAPPRCPVVANFDGQANSDADRVKELLVRQVDGAVRWEESVQLMATRGIRHALEIGPGKVLAGLVRRIAKEIKVLSVGDLASLEMLPAFLANAG